MRYFFNDSFYCFHGNRKADFGRALATHKRVEHIRFERIDFSIYIAEFSLNIRIFCEKFSSSTKKSIPLKLLLTLR